MNIRKTVFVLLCTLLVLAQMPVYGQAIKIGGGSGSGGGITVPPYKGSTYITVRATAGEGGSISPDGQVRVKKGDSISFTITPDAGYTVDDVLISGKSLGPVTTYTFENVTAPRAIQVTFQKARQICVLPPPVVVNSSASEGGSIEPAGSHMVGCVNTAVDYKITPEEGYHISDVLVDGESVGAVSFYQLIVEHSGQTVEALFERNPSMFTDVQGRKDQYDIDAVVKAGLFSGTSENNFEPDAPMTRAMFVTVLGRFANAKEPAIKRFDDVPIEAWYAPYVAWGVRFGIMKGTGDSLFSPDKAVSRQEMAVLVDRYLTFRGIKLPPDAQVKQEFCDVKQIAPWAQASVTRLQLFELIEYGENLYYRPEDAATRAEVAVLFARLLEFVK